MNEAILIWLYLSIGNVLAVLGVVAVLSMITVVGVVMGIVVEGSDWSDYPAAIKTCRIVTICSAIVLTVACFYPSKDALKWIIGGAVVWNVVENTEGVKELPQNVVDAMKHFLEAIPDKDKEVQ